MRLIDADYLTGRMFTEADLSNAHTCYDSIRAIIESMESEDVLDNLRAEIEFMDFDFGDYYDHTDEIIDKVCKVIDKYKAESEDKK